MKYVALILGLLLFSWAPDAQACEAHKSHSVMNEAAPITLAANSGHVCFKNCLEQNGTTAKASCAMQCGLVKAPGNRGGGQDCGMRYKSCMQTCGSNNSCKSKCRKARSSCI